MKIQDFVVLDLETTGLSVKEDQILEIGAVKVQGGEVTASYETFVNPGRKVPERITELTGIRDEMIADGALGMGAAFTFVLVCSNIMISLLRKVIPGKVHLPCYIVIIASFVTIVQMFMQAYMESLYNALGVFLPLIVVNCIILGRAEMFACKNSIVDSALDGVGMGVGYTLTATLMASIREILGSGTWLGFQVIPESVAKVSIMTQAPGAFFCFGLLMAGCVWLEGKLDARIERKSCCDLDNLKKEAE